MNTDLSQLDPPQVDQLWAEAMTPAHAISARLSAAETEMRRYRRHNQEPAFLVERIADLTEKLSEASKASEPFDAEYERRGGWTRYLQVVSSSNGHVHRTSTRCSAVHFTTLVAPVFALSGRDDDGVVEEIGEVACSKCFPEAPTIAREQRERASAQQRAAKAAEREEKAKIKLAKTAARLRKLVAKVDAFYETVGGREQFLAMTYSDAYDAAMHLPATVFQEVLDDHTDHSRGGRWGRDPRKVIAEAEAQGL